MLLSAIDDARALDNAGIRMPIRSAMIPMTTSSSTNVNPPGEPTGAGRDESERRDIQNSFRARIRGGIEPANKAGYHRRCRYNETASQLQGRDARGSARLCLAFERDVRTRGLRVAAAAAVAGCGQVAVAGAESDKGEGPPAAAIDQLGRRRGP